MLLKLVFLAGKTETEILNRTATKMTIMVKKIGKILIIILVVVIAVSLFVGVWYFYFSAKGTFNSVTITDKNDKESMVNPFLPINTFEAGENISLSIWVSGTSNFLLSEQVTLSASSSGGAFTCAFDPPQAILDYGYSGSRSTLTITTFPKSSNFIEGGTPAGTYTVTVIGTDSSGVEHQDSYSFSVVS